LIDRYYKETLNEALNVAIYLLIIFEVFTIIKFRSFYVATMMQIIMTFLSVPVTILINRGIFRIEYLNNQLGYALFVVPLIANNNVFYFYSKWTKS